MEASEVVAGVDPAQVGTRDRVKGGLVVCSLVACVAVFAVLAVWAGSRVSVGGWVAESAPQTNVTVATVMSVLVSLAILLFVMFPWGFVFGLAGSESKSALRGGAIVVGTFGVALAVVVALRAGAVYALASVASGPLWLVVFVGVVLLFSPALIAGAVIAVFLRFDDRGKR